VPRILSVDELSPGQEHSYLGLLCHATCPSIPECFTVILAVKVCLPLIDDVLQFCFMLRPEKVLAARGNEVIDKLDLSLMKKCT
jgi:hypothetical protein